MASIEASSPTVVLLDIEGTIAPITFVHDVLFPYALNALPEVCTKYWQDRDFQKYVKDFPKEAQGSPDALVSHVKELTAKDVKVAYLKNLQGYLWKTGYETGAFTTPLFPDVTPFLRRCAASQPPIRLAIYSSGSVAAQKLFASYVVDNSTGKTVDLKPLFSAYFDTVNAGNKLQASSYHEITKQLQVSPGAVEFYTDNPKEAEAADEVGMRAFMVVRPGNAPLTSDQTEYWTSKGRLIHTFETANYS